MPETYEPPTTSPASPPYDHTPGASALLPPSTQIDTIQQSSTNRNENSCPRVTRARAREATAFRWISLGMNCAQAAADSWSCRPLVFMPIDRTQPRSICRSPRTSVGTHGGTSLLHELAIGAHDSRRDVREVPEIIEERIAACEDRNVILALPRRTRPTRSPHRSSRTARSKFARCRTAGGSGRQSSPPQFATQGR